ncbi:MAG: hypothetical protein EBT49_06360 [Betaproteobacteria bacterium]|nr:hypothetical protein [Betaproteobacteria bacterium]
MRCHLCRGSKREGFRSSLDHNRRFFAATQETPMIIERVNLQDIKQQDHVSTLQALEVGESIYCDDARKAQSIRVLSYYLVRSRKLDRKFVFRKMDRGWRIIRVI